MAGSLPKALLFVLLTVLGSIALATVLDPSVDGYTPSPPLEAGVYSRLWGFNWSGGLDIRLEGSESREYRGGVVTVNHYTYALTPGDPGCRVHAWLYTSGGGGDAWVILIHGLGGSHAFWEEPLGGYRVAYDLAVRGFRVLAIDAAGHGLSCIPGGSSWVDRASTIEPGEFFLYYVYLSGVRAVEAAKALGASPGKIAVMGVSMGGMTSYVVASIHPDVSLAVPIVASGCLPCMIQSGGLANLVGPVDVGVTEGVVAKLAASDPLSYIEMAGGSGWLRGKLFYILFSGHDEFFPTEGLILTVEALESHGATVAVSFAGNNNHYSAAPGWLESAMEVLTVFRDGGAAEVGRVLSARAAEPTSLGALVGGGQQWRPGADGLAYLPGIPLAPLILNGEVVGAAGVNPGASLLPREAPLALKVAMLALLTLAAGYVAARWSIQGWGAALPAAYASAAAYAIPYWEWPGRFSLSLLGVMERYGVTPSGTLGIPTLQLLTLAVALSPALAAAVALSRRRLWLIVYSILYLAVSLLPFALMRLTIGFIEARAPAPLPATLAPVEAAYPIILAAVLAGRR